MRILLVEDAPARAPRTQMLLEMAGHQVVQVASAAQALASFEADPFPVVVAELASPRFDGYELCRRIRARSRQEYVYFVILVPEHEQFRFQEAEAAQVDDVLVAPVDPDVLRARMRVAERMLGLYTDLDRLCGLIPICAYCKKIRQEQGLWQQLEAYLAERSHARFTHTICPACARREFGGSPHHPEDAAGPSAR